MLHPKGHKDMQPKNSADISRTSYFPRTSNRNSENHQKNEVRCWPFFCLKMPRTSIPADKLGCTYWYFFPRTFSDISRTSRGCPLYCSSQSTCIYLNSGNYHCSGYYKGYIETVIFMSACNRLGCQYASLTLFDLVQTKFARPAIAKFPRPHQN